MGQIFKDEKVVPVTLLSLEKNVDTDFEVGAKLKISGTAKGRGFQGVVKRHGFHGGPKTHGQKHTHRAPGSIGSTGPQRVIPGVKMAGRMGGNKVTVRNLEVAAFDKERGILMLKGAVPGNKGMDLRIYISEKKNAD